MRLPALQRLAAVFYVVVGMAFANWPNETLGLMGIDPLGAKVGFDPDPARQMPIWTLLAFTRLYGTTLAGAGAVVFFLRSVPATAQAPVVTGLFVFNLLAAAMTFLQQLSILSVGGGGGWVLAAAFLLLAVGYGRLLFSTRGVAFEPGRSSSDHTIGELRESWIRELKEAAAQEERARLARELHDSIKQQLFTINVTAAASEARLASDPAAAREALAGVRQATQEAMAEMEALLQHLQPSPLAGVGLVEALRKQCEATRFRTGAEVTLEAASLPDEALLPPGAHASLFRIAQEALSNVARHARASHVRVTLRTTSDARPSLELAIEDDGGGFDPATATGMGLSGVRDRCHALGGSATVDAAPGHGTRLRARVPLTLTEPATIARWLQRAALCGLVVVFHAGFPGRPLVGGRVFWLWLPFAAAAAGFGVYCALRARRELARLAGRLGGESVEVLRVRRYRAQLRALVLIGAVTWNPLVTATTASYFGLDAQRASGPVLAVALLAVLASLVPVHRAFRALAARTTADALRKEKRLAFRQSVLPLAVLLCTIGVYAVFFHALTAPVLPVGLALWLLPFVTAQPDRRLVGSSESPR